MNGYYNDIALFKLDRPVDLNEYTIPVCLPDEYEGTALDTLVGRSSNVIGWGVTQYGTSLRHHSLLNIEKALNMVFQKNVQ